MRISPVRIILGLLAFLVVHSASAQIYAPAFTTGDNFWDGTLGTSWVMPNNALFVPSPAVTVTVAPANSSGAIDWPLVGTQTLCYTIGTTLPTAPTAGTCGAGSNTYSTPFSLTGNAQLNALSTEVGQTNSAVTTINVTFEPFFPVAGTYAYSPSVILSGTQGSNLIYTTDGSAPTANGSCAATGTGTAAANGTSITVGSSETVKFAPCSGGTLGTVQTAAYVIRSPDTWFVRQGGGTLYNASTNPSGQCDGLADVNYPGSGTNQHCAVSNLQYLYLNGVYGSSGWNTSGFAGGDTLVIRGCAALPGEQNPSPPNCRIGLITNNNASGSSICQGVSPFWGCSMPPPPSGNASHHTRILGGCAYDGNCTPVTTYPYTSNNLTQLFGGFGAGAVLYLNRAWYIDIEGLEFTSHNGVCSNTGAPAYPAACPSSSPYDDNAKYGIVTTDGTASPTGTAYITLQDVYIHGFTVLGIGGALGGPWTSTRVSIDFNAFAGWNFDDGNSTQNAPGSTLTQSYVTFIGNGCQEQYPITNTQFPAMACWDSSSGGFGDSWSGQNTTLTSFTCDHCVNEYNTKDGAIGPHTLTANISLTNSIWAGDMGQEGKWGQGTNATFLAQNNLFVGNCMRMASALPGAHQNFNQTTGLGGSYLSNFCRAAGNVFDYFADAGSTVNFVNNSFVTYQPTVFDFGCNTANACGSTPYNITNNIFLGYTTTTANYPNSGQAPGMYVKDDSSVDIVASHDIESGVRNGDTCGTNGVICSDPLWVGEPAQGAYPPDSIFDAFNFNLISTSPARVAGTTGTYVPTTDYTGAAQTSPPTIGAYVYAAPPSVLGGGLMNGRIASLVITCPSATENCPNCLVFVPSACQIKVVLR